MKEEALRLDRVTRLVDGVPVLEGVNLHLFRGEVLGLVCLNAYGQDELVSLLQQNLPLHYGKIYLNEQLVNSYERSAPSFNRVSVIDQQSRLVDDLTVADNIFVLRRGFRKFVVSRRQLDRQLQQFLGELDVELRGEALISQLTPYQKCVVELLRAVVLGIRLIVVRNISNYVSTEDLARFHRLLRHYCEKGFSFLYICSHHEEAFKVCDRLALQAGTRIQKVLNRSQFTRQSIEPYYLDFYRAQAFGPLPTGRPGVLRFEDLCAGQLRGLSFSVEAGECVVLLDSDLSALRDISGVMGGQLAPTAGRVTLAGAPYTPAMARRPTRSGVAFIQQYPVESMVFQDMSYLDNLCFLLDKRRRPVRPGARVRQSVVREYGPLVGDAIHSQDVNALPLAALYSMVYYRVHLAAPRVVFCIQPFSNADMVLRLHITRLIQDLKRKGISVVILAVNLSDSLIVSDRLLIVQEGRLAQEFPRAEFYRFEKDATSIG